MSADPRPLPAWLTDPALTRVWSTLHDRLAARGRTAEGRVRIAGLDRSERHSLAGLLGRPVVAATVTIDLADLDSGLRDRSGVGGLLEVVEAVTGRTVADRPGDRERRRAERAAPLETARALLGHAPWCDDWVAGVRRSGVLTRSRDPDAAVRRAAAVLARLPEPVSRTELAATAAGGAHALDDGRVTTALVLRALAIRCGQEPPSDAAGRRELWERFGVRVDLVSTTCLTLGLRCDGPAGSRLALAAEAGDPVHLTPWDLRRNRPSASHPVLVCENPRVLEAVAERYGGTVPMVCTSGQPSLVAHDLLVLLAADGPLHYHGDFDWPGIAIANRMVEQVGVVPWRMTAEDYACAAGTAQVPLAGDPVDPVWDAELGAAMRHHGVAVHEEAVLERLLGRLADHGP
ncbi:TIGR02679 family protein [Pseudonocardia nematodicida]|uniref:TIGR02679 family protein n=1 Tax=Pseudonocardia nematodicida TaxID=1206997 RepID=A0ABV1KFJ8_9PSEU